MTDVGFYHLTSRPLDAVLPRLLEKAVSGGHRVVLRSVDAVLLARLDGLLWTYDPASFLPHAIDGEHAAMQSVLLTSDDANPNGAGLLAVVDGALPGDLDAYARVLYLFDGGDDNALALARRHWRALKAREGITATYWKEDDAGRWGKAA